MFARCWVWVGVARIRVGFGFWWICGSCVGLVLGILVFDYVSGCLGLNF